MSNENIGKETLTEIFFRNFRRNRLAIAGFIIVAFFFIVAILAPFISPYPPDGIDVKHILQPPDSEHIFGTDTLGRDVFSRVVYGSQISLMVGFIAVGISTLIGILIGSIAG